MTRLDIFRKKIREFDPLDIGVWAPISEFDHMWPKIESMLGPDESEFVTRTTRYFMSCFADGELPRSELEVKAFFKELHRALTKDNDA